MNIGDRKRFSEEVLNKLRTELDSRLAERLGEEPESVTIYVTGFFGRLEASPYSDVDAFIAGHAGSSQRTISRLDEISLKADLIAAVKAMDLPEFDGDGDYLRYYSSGDLLEGIGRRTDDHDNTSTARLLLLLESRPLMGARAYLEVRDEVIAEYWRDYERHKGEFSPIFLINDILRFWRTLCVAYEMRTTLRDEDEDAGKRRLNNYKLKHSRVLTCFSTILALLAIYRTNGTVTTRDAQRIVGIEPLERLFEGVDRDNRKLVSALDDARGAYEVFLEHTAIDKHELRQNFRDSKYHHERKREASNFGDAVYKALMCYEDEGSIFRRVVV